MAFLDITQYYLNSWCWYTCSFPPTNTLKMSVFSFSFAFVCTYAAIQVQFLLNTTTGSEDSVVRLGMQYLLQPPNVTFLEPIVVMVTAVNGSATGRLQVLLHVLIFNYSSYTDSGQLWWVLSIFFFLLLLPSPCRGRWLLSGDLLTDIWYKCDIGPGC